MYLKAFWFLVLAHTLSISLSSKVRHRRAELEYNLDETGWGPWGSSSTCTRSCGGGVFYQERVCHNTTESDTCVGPSRIYRSCNIAPCPEGNPDFRSVQCSRFNNVSFNGKYYDWMAYYAESTKCALDCIARGEYFYSRLAERVVDGTPCIPKEAGVCVEGQCRPLGCDRMLDSSAVEDKCRVCGGDGSSCTTMAGVFMNNGYQIGYNDLLLIPAGATNIKIFELDSSSNYLAVRNMSDFYFLNGNWRIDYEGSKEISGTTFEYKRDPYRHKSPESLQALGPTKEAIFLVVLRPPRTPVRTGRHRHQLLYQGHNTGIEYEYSIPVKDGQEEVTYTWSAGAWQPCSQTCGEGFQTRSVFCSTETSSDAVDESLCDPTTRPAENHTCNLQHCPASWHLGEWDDCSKTCDGGYQFRIVYCEQVRGDIAMAVDDTVCIEQQGAMPPTQQRCNTQTKCPRWEVGRWSKCNQMCGEGRQTRVVMCLSQELVNGTKQVVSNSSCEAALRPKQERVCDAGPCEGYEWLTTAWSKCFGPCDNSVQSREVVCASRRGIVQSLAKCDPRRKPDAKRPCPEGKGRCKGLWFASEWSECSSNCGRGFQVRSVYCVAIEGEKIRRLPDSSCLSHMRMVDRQECFNRDCDPTWFAGPWATCSAPCGGGYRRRDILCIHDGQIEKIKRCKYHLRLDARESCNLHPCDDDNLIVTEGCKSSRYGCCPDGLSAALGPQYAGCDSSSMEKDCQNAAFGCCLDGKTPAQGPFNFGCPMFTCKSSKHGCCDDDLTAADGPNKEGCPEVVNCELSKYGCCPDGFTAAGGKKANGEKVGCPEKETELPCVLTQFGCCSDGETAATGPNEEGCVEGSGSVCEDSVYGCCEDGFTPANGPNRGGCDTNPRPIPESLTTVRPVKRTEQPVTTAMKNIPDSATRRPPTKAVTLPTQEKDYACLNSAFGCCPDMISEAIGPDNEGCAVIIPPEMTTVAAEVVTSSGEVVEGDDTTSSGFVTEPVEVVTTVPVTADVEETIDPGSGSSEEDGEENIDGSVFPATEPASTAAPVTRRPAPAELTTEVPLTNLTALHCNESQYGCCPESVSVALGPDEEGCPNITTTQSSINCNMTEFGCCNDKLTPASGWDMEGCPEMTKRPPTVVELTTASSQITVPPKPSTTDKPTHAPFVNMSELFPEIEVVEIDTEIDCNTSLFGCCPDGLTPAKGLDEEGCSDTDEKPTTEEIPDYAYWTVEAKIDMDKFPCRKSRFGCCPNGRYPAKGPNQEGCAFTTTMTTVAITTSRPTPSGSPCIQSDFGCCKDGISFAFGPNFEGCDEKMEGGCENTPFGCCPDGTAAQGENNEGCTDSLAVFEVPDCIYSDFGCCLDGATPATGPDYQGCGHEIDCTSTKFGCCPKSKLAATGLGYEGCPSDVMPGKLCMEPSSTGSCRNFSVMWYYDQAYGDCARFWYGGCEGNKNRFATREECKSTCVEPEGTDICVLPKETGDCDDSDPSFYYEVKSMKCLQFTYTGCKGNKNRFRTIEECEKRCLIPRKQNRCAQLKISGPCNGTIERWYYNSATGQCEDFIYGGCKGNTNRFYTKRECEWMCARDVEKATCDEKKTVGPCTQSHPSFAYDHESDQCEAFNYSGCGGNRNRYHSFNDCNRKCVKKQIDTCSLTPESGPCTAYSVRWFHDPQDGYCKEFYYGGCQGNANNFETHKECKASCNATDPPKEEERADTCMLQRETGPCRGKLERWYFDRDVGKCMKFNYGGCQGNENRFLTKQRCVSTCPEVTTPAPTTTTVATTTTTSTTTTTTTLAPTTTEADVCLQQRYSGTCNGFFPVWYFNAQLKTCRRFLYGGCDGNGNRFDTFAECENRCVHQITTTPAVLTEEETSTVTMEPEVIVFDLCQEPVDAGPCDARLVRWYFDKDYGDCRWFLYGGCKGNANIFDSESECKQICIDRKLKKSDMCSLVRDAGPCKAILPRYYFNQEKQSCEHFYYGGCEGNANRFISAAECESSCVEETFESKSLVQDLCHLPREVGKCYDSMPRWYFSYKSRMCHPFNYTGCDGNGNRFNSREECDAYCRPKVIEDICVLPKAVGSCTMNIPRWYYDHTTAKCRQFEYSGCHGNRNRFVSEVECYYSCVTKSIPTPSPTTTTTTSTTTIDPCEKLQCNLLCPYGLVMEDGCEQCRCHDPCRDIHCTSDMSCAAEEVQCVTFPCPLARPVCRLKIKPGICPLAVRSSNDAISRDICVVQCRSDADCKDENKCCQTGCGAKCLAPVKIITEKPPEERACKSSMYGCCLDGRTPAKGYNLRGCPKVSPAIKKPKTTQILTVAGQTVQLPCDATGAPLPMISWYKDRFPMMIHHMPEKYRKHPNGTLIIYKASKKDAGYYTCRAYNGFGKPATQGMSVMIQVPTKILSTGPRDLSIKPRSTVTLNCEAKGLPSPKISWFLNGMPIQDTFAIDRMRLLFNNSLQIFDVGLDHEGEYTCEAYNGVGKPQKQITTVSLVDTAKISTDIAVFIESHNDTYEHGSRIDLRCNATGYPPPQIIWYKNKGGDRLKESEKYEFDDMGCLAIYNATEEDSGVYYCSANNARELKTNSTKIKVNPPVKTTTVKTSTTTTQPPPMTLPPNCKDQPKYANCLLIIRANLCKHHYFSRFCCESCYRAKKLP